MKILLSNKTEDGIEHIVKIGGESVIINEQNDLKIPVVYGELEILIDRLNELKSKIKPIRGQRAKCNFYEDSAGDFEMPTYMGTFEEKKPNEIDFKSVIQDKKNNKDKNIVEFNSVLEDNIEEIENLFKKDCYSSYTVHMSKEASGYAKLTIKQVTSDKEKLYEFGYIHGRGDGHAIKENTMNRLKNFIVNIAVKNSK